MPDRATGGKLVPLRLGASCGFACKPLRPESRGACREGGPIRFRYLRLSVTDRCQLRCLYCMPPEGVRFASRNELLTIDEQLRAVRLLARRGIEKVRITGGEPLLRKGLPRLIEGLVAIPGIREVALTTNGLLLTRHAAALAAAGLSRVNVSLDSLDPVAFERITRGGSLAQVLAGIDAACVSGLSRVKVNVVALRGLNDEQLPAFAKLALSRPVEVRFIERMPLGGPALSGGFMSETDIRAALACFQLSELPPDGGPARRYSLTNGARTGTVGFISAMSRPFCEGCDRLRLTADGQLRACLFDGTGIPLRHALRHDAGDEAIEQAIEAASHGRRVGTHGDRIETAAMSAVGG